MEFDKTLKVGLLLVQPEPSAPAGGLVKAELAEGFRDGLGGENSMLTPNRAAISFATCRIIL